MLSQSSSTCIAQVASQFDVSDSFCVSKNYGLTPLVAEKAISPHPISHDAKIGLFKNGIF